MNERITALRERMRDAGIDAFIAFSSDFHASEYLSEHFKLREYLSGFTGSSGTLVVTMSEAALFTDGRYFVQARHQLDNSGIALMRMGEAGVPTPEEYLSAALPEGAVVAVDGRTISAKMGESLERALKTKLKIDADIAPWPDRPPLPNNMVFALPIEYAGVSAGEKLAELRQVMALEGASAHMLTTLDDIAWLFNLRGGDISYTPLALAYAYISAKGALLFIGEGRVADDAKRELSALGVELRPYEAVYSLEINEDERVLVDKDLLNYTLYARIAQSAKVIHSANPTRYRKAQKNAVERRNMAEVHIFDGAAVVKLMHSIHTKLSHGERLSEYDVARMADAFRAQCPECIGPSFATIAGFAQNGAIVHYMPQKQSALTLERRGMLLIDSGGQYKGGTTDLTRTIALGPVSHDMRRHYTLVLKGLLELSSLRFPANIRGDQLDAIARAALWREGLDYNHGTSHGIGSFLCVHEPPIVINWRRRSGVLSRGMVLSDEPGMYVEGSHGVRLENQLLVKEDIGSFLSFETLTLAPFDKRLIDTSLLGADNMRHLNNYHARVYQALAPLLNNAQRAWLEAQTRPL